MPVSFIRFSVMVISIKEENISTMNSEIYAALIDAGLSEDKARAAVSVTDYERDINEVKSDLKLIKWGIGLIVAAEVLPLMKSFFAG